MRYFACTLVALLVTPVLAHASKPIDTRFNAAYFAAKTVVRICKDYEHIITKAAYENEVTTVLRVRPVTEPAKIAVPTADGGTCTSTVDSLTVDGQRWVRIRTPEEAEDYVDIIYRGPEGGQPKALGTFAPYVSPACGLDGQAGRELGMSPRKFAALPDALRDWLCHH